MTEERKDDELAPNAEVSLDELVRSVADALEENDMPAAVALVDGLRVPDLADVLTLLGREQRVHLINGLGRDFNYEVLSELDETVRDHLSEDLPNEVLAKAITELESDDAAYLLENLEESDKQEILSQLSSGDRQALQRNLDYPEDTAGRLMQADYVAVAPFWTVGHVIDHMRETEDLPDHFTEIFVVDPAYRVLGSVDLSRLLRSKRETLMNEIMEPDRHLVLATEGQEEVARQFQRYDLVSAPVVDEDQRLVGVVTVDDFMDVLHEEAEEDMKALAGVGDEDLGGSVWESVQSRVPWLIVNLGTAFIASWVIGQFDATIEQMVSLAVLMPIVASMGGNAGTQTMTVTVRALATKQLGAVNAPKVISREIIVALINGIFLSVILAGVVFLWFGSGKLGGVIAVAMMVNSLAAGLSGILIPLTMDRLEFDPAPASGVFVSTVTDVVGFFAFLGLASVWLL